MEDKLRRLYNTMSLIETRGENTKLMGNCLQFVEQLIAESREPRMTDPKTPKTPKSKAAKAE